MRRVSVAGSVLLLGAVGGLSACSGGDDADGARALAAQLAAALGAGPTAAASGTASGSASPSPSGSASASASSDAPGTALATVPFTGTGEATAPDLYAAVVEGMGRVRPTVRAGEVSVEDATATVPLRWSWALTEGGDPWRYTSTATLTRRGERWSVAWAPSLVSPDLRAGEVLDVDTATVPRAPITGAGGSDIVTERPVLRIGVDRTLIEADAAEATARALASLVGIDVDPYVKAVTSAGPKAFVEAIVYRPDDIPDAVSSGLRGIPGVRQVSDELPLAPTRTFAAPILGRVGPVTAEMVAEDPSAYRPGDIAGVSGLQARYDAQLRGRPGRTVYAVPGEGAAASASPTDGADPASATPSAGAEGGADGGRRVLFQLDPVAGEPLALTLDPRLQTLAEQVLADVAPASALVALRPSDGAVLAAANGPGTNGRNDATFGRFAPGSTFKIVSSLALLRAGLTPDSPVDCTPGVTVDGKRFGNYSDYPASSLGRIPLAEAVAQSCNTAFIGARAKVGDGALAAAAASLGLGIDRDLGFPSYFGQVPTPASETEAAADLIGQGKIQASPLVMATVIASVQAGRTVVPSLVTQVATPQPEGAEALAPDEVSALRAMLRRVVTEGSGRGLVDLPGGPVIAKTGTAEYADSAAGGEVRTHAWMVAAQDDIAVAVFVQTGESGSRTAGPLLARFLRGAR